jgi:dynein light chain LC8-type
LKIHHCETAHDILHDAVEIAARDIEKKCADVEIAANLKKEFDKRYNKEWQCIVGKNFGAFVSNEEEYAVYFTYGQVSVLLFKAG